MFGRGFKLDLSEGTLTHVEIDLELRVPALPALRLVLQPTPVRGPVGERGGRDRQRARRQQRHPRVVQLQRLLVLQSTLYIATIYKMVSISRYLIERNSN